jgi:hypothetical protein
MVNVFPLVISRKIHMTKMSSTDRGQRQKVAFSKRRIKEAKIRKM